MNIDKMIAATQLHMQVIDDACSEVIDDLRINRVITIKCNVTADDCMVEYFTGTPLEQIEMIRVEEAIKKLFGEREVDVCHCLDVDIED